MSQASEFLEALPGCGAQAFRQFLSALKDSTKLAHKELADLLKEKLVEKTSVS